MARLAYFGLFALQHRGQESAGIAVSERGRLTTVREMGLVAQVFDEETLQSLPGEVAIGHTRYSTTGGVRWANAQPLVQHGRARTIALGHNGNLTNTAELRDVLRADGVRLGLDLGHRGDRRAVGERRGAVRRRGRRRDAPARRRVLGGRDRRGHARRVPDAHGIRPLSLGRIGDDWVVASETCALDLIGASTVRDVRPGEIVAVDADGLHSVQALPEGGDALCIFEHVYFARPDSTLAGTEVHGARCAWASGSPRRRPSTRRS